MGKFFIVLALFILQFISLSAETYKERLIEALNSSNINEICITNESQFSDQDLQDLLDNVRHHNKITKIILNKCDKITDEGVAILVQNLKNLRCFAIVSCPQITDESLRYIATIKKLEDLTIYQNDNITDRGIKYLGEKNQEKLNHLTLARCKNLTDDGIIFSILNSPLITWLDISCCPLLTDKCLEAIALNLPMLKTLDFSLCPLITDQGIFMLCKYLVNLQAIDMLSCPNISDTAIRYITDSLDKLCLLNICGCANISRASVDYLVRRHEALIFLAVSVHNKLTQEEINEIRSYRSNYNLIVFNGTEQDLQEYPLSMLSDIMCVKGMSYLNAKVKEYSFKYFIVYESDTAKNWP